MVTSLADYYERLVKEYLELMGFLVRTNTRFKKGRGWGDIDIIAIDSSRSQIIVGEVKTRSMGKTDIDGENEDFNNLSQQNKIKEILGNENYDKYIFCWGADEEVKRYAKENYGIHILQFWEIINYLIDKVREIRHKGRWRYERGIGFPNLMLLQMLYHFSKEYKGKIRVDLNKLLRP